MTSRIPIRWRLTFWYAALLALTLAVFGAVLFVGQRYTLRDNFDEQVRTQTAVTLAVVQTGEGGPALAPDAMGPTNGEHFVRLLAADGRIIADTSPTVGDVPIDARAVAAALHGQTSLTSVRAAGSTFRVVTTPVQSAARVVGVLQVGQARDDVDETLAALLTLLGVCAPLVLVAAVGGGYLLAGRALAPVTAISSLAASIGGTRDDLRARLNLTLPDDELGQLAHTFDQMLERIEHAFERQRQFTADAAHELRTPLTLMRGQIDLALARPRTEDEYREALQALDADLERLTSLVRALLTLARADRGQLPLVRDSFDLAETVSVVTEQYAELAAEAGISLSADTRPAPLCGDDDLLVQVLVNLLDNALAHTAAGDTVTIGCRPDGADQEVRMWVEDSGSGISPEHLPHVFERFYRSDSGRTRDQGGAGLGLNICRAIVEAHGGTIELTSELGHGTRVEIVLPAEA